MIAEKERKKTREKSLNFLSQSFLCCKKRERDILYRHVVTNIYFLLLLWCCWKYLNMYISVEISSFIVLKVKNIQHSYYNKIFI